MARYWEAIAVNGRWSRWVQPIRRGYKFCCCDCGLVHDMDFRVSKGRAQFRVARNNRSTAQVRRHMKKDT
jgi:hypothetical protein